MIASSHGSRRGTPTLLSKSHAPTSAAGVTTKSMRANPAALPSRRKHAFETPPQASRMTPKGLRRTKSRASIRKVHRSVAKYPAPRPQDWIPTPTATAANTSTTLNSIPRLPRFPTSTLAAEAP